MLDKIIPDAIVPQGIPKGLILLLVVACMLLGLSGLRHGGMQGWLVVLENWLVMLIIIPACTALVSAPLKWRDDSFDIKMAYYLGMFVAFLFMIGKLRYWR